MAWCIKCGGAIRRKGISYGDEIVFCQCEGRKKKR